MFATIFLSDLAKGSFEALDNLPELPVQKLEHLNKARPKRNKSRAPTRPVAPGMCACMFVKRHLRVHGYVYFLDTGTIRTALVQVVMIQEQLGLLSTGCYDTVETSRGCICCQRN